ncbi:hypothetical protein [Brucella intermedia]|uniref:hypothetical protein n=1 Tax=Brucella intermedia TaxID=94625 RepID=UPI00235E8DA4|nr:hypothetical protein [Brucella intermedia]
MTKTKDRMRLCIAKRIFSKRFGLSTTTAVFLGVCCNHANAVDLVFDIPAELLSAQIDSTTKHMALTTDSIDNSNKEIQANTTDIKKTDRKILSSLTDDRTKDTAQLPNGEGMTTDGSPSVSEVLGVKSGEKVDKTAAFKESFENSQRTAKTLIAGMNLSSSLMDAVSETQKAAGDREGATKVDLVNSYWDASISAMETMLAVNEQIAKGIIAREEAMKKAAAQAGKSKDIKGSMDENTRMQVENTRAINDLIGVQNYSLSSENVKMRDNLMKQSQVSKLLTNTKGDPFL